MPDPAITRESAYLPDGAEPLFSWLHRSPEAEPRDCVAVLCPPLGHEYTRSHRSVRHLADRLAASGVPALRFDYHGVGDSPGTDLDPARIETWTRNVRAAIAHARSRTGCAQVCLVGIRLGATLAALATAEEGVDLLVLWNPCVKGKAYVREMQAIAALAARASQVEGALESAGFILSAETLETLKGIDLLEQPLRVTRRALLFTRDDQAPDPALARHLVSLGIACDEERVPGWNAMMADHQYTVVPDAALATLVSWVRGQTTSDRGQTTCALPGGQAPAPAAGNAKWSDPGSGVVETACSFGPDGALFGILARASEDSGRPAIVMFNAGSVHHVGPNRLYVMLARSLAAMGFACLRFDLAGIGDSVLRGPGRENHPYPPHATADARAALDFLKERYGYRRFIALGLCSGANTAFHTALAASDDAIGELILINPYNFYWREGMSLDVMTQFEDLHAYKKSMRDPRRWLKLLRGEVDFRRMLEVAVGRPRTLARSYLDAVREKLMPGKAPPLSRDLQKLMDMKRRMTFVIAEGDPGHDMLMTQARRTATRGFRSGAMRLETIAGADHTFTGYHTRRELVERLGALCVSALPAELRVTQPQSLSPL